MANSKKPNILSSKKRLSIMWYATMLMLLVLVGHLATLSFVRAEELQKLAVDQWTSEIAVMPQRGAIVSINGDTLAQSATVESVLLRPKDIEAESKKEKDPVDPAAVSKKLSAILEMNEQEIFEKATKTSSSEVWLKRHITEKQAKEIREAKLPGVGLFTDIKRYYPFGEFMSQVLGYTNMDGEGQEGLEKKYNKYLSGYPGTKLALVDYKNRTIADSEEIYISPKPGLNVVLTVDSIIQSFLESAARDALEVNQAKSVVGIVMNPKDASILGMVNYPETDLNNLDRKDTAKLAELSKNRAIVDAYEPGSTFKIITTASALDSGVVSLENTFHCPGYKIVDGERIKCWRSGNPHGTQKLIDAVGNSCNPAFMEMALAMGTDNFYEYIRNFGFGQTTGIDYSADASGIIRASKYIKPVDLARIGFGQSVAVTPMQLITAVSSVINGGTLYTPRFVSHLSDENGEIVEEFKAQEVRKVISEETSEKMRTILENVVENGGGKNARIEGYRVGGKTGTAQVYDQSGKIAEGKNISSFIGFAPVDDPKYVVLFIVYEPGVPVTFGSVVAAPFAKEVLEKCLKYGEVPADESVDEKLVTVPSFAGKTLEEAKVTAEEYGLQIDYSGAGEIVNQSPAQGAEVVKGSLVELIGYKEEEDPQVVPDLKGKTLVEAYETLRLMSLGVFVDYEGCGIIESQTPLAGETIPPDRQIKVTCYDKNPLATPTPSASPRVASVEDEVPLDVSPTPIPETSTVPTPSASNSPAPS